MKDAELQMKDAEIQRNYGKIQNKNIEIQRNNIEIQHLTTALHDKDIEMGAMRSELSKLQTITPHLSPKQVTS